MIKPEKFNKKDKDFIYNCKANREANFNPFKSEYIKPSENNYLNQRKSIGSITSDNSNNNLLSSSTRDNFSFTNLRIDELIYKNCKLIKKERLYHRGNQGNKY